MISPEGLDIGGDVERLDIDERGDAGGIEPGEEVRHGPVIGDLDIGTVSGGPAAGVSPSIYDRAKVMRGPRS